MKDFNFFSNHLVVVSHTQRTIYHRQSILVPVRPVQDQCEVQNINMLVYTQNSTLASVTYLLSNLIKQQLPCRLDTFGPPTSFTTNWDERSALQSVTVWRSIGNYVSGHYFPIIFSFLFLFSVVYFSHRRSAWIKKLIQRNLLRVANNLDRHYFGPPLWPLWILQAAVQYCRR